jgi:hypothetical protein
MSTQPQSKRRTWLWVALAAALVVVLGVGGFLGYRAILGGVTITGELLLSDPDLDDFAPTCRGEGGFDDVHEGAQLVITDEAGTTLALTRLVGGKEVDTNVCRFTFSAEVPDRPFYGVEMNHRGRIQYSKADASDGITLAIGD